MKIKVHQSFAQAGPVDAKGVQGKIERIAGDLPEVCMSAGESAQQLKDVGAVTGEEIKAWDKLRHPTAHGSWEPKAESMQVHFDDLYKLLTLVYRLVFVHIGYDGRFDARNVRGWPVHEIKGKEAQAALGLQ